VVGFFYDFIQLRCDDVTCGILSSILAKRLGKFAIASIWSFFIGDTIHVLFSFYAWMGIGLRRPMEMVASVGSVVLLFCCSVIL